MAWQPQSEGLDQILQVLRNAHSTDNTVQLQVQQKLREFNQIPEYNNYLMYILTQMPNEGEPVRAMAGLLLKNNIRFIEKVHPSVVAYIQQRSIQSLGDPLPLVRGTIGIIITTLLTKMGVTGWPDVVPYLIQHLDNPDANIVEGAFGAMQKICEDSGNKLESTTVEAMIPKFIQHADHPVAKIRIHALTCTNQFISLQSQPLYARLEAYTQALSRRATDQVGEVRRLVCQAFVMLLEARPDVLLPILQSIVPFMLYATQDQDEAVALEACEFWFTFVEHSGQTDQLKGYLPQIIPVLLKTMLYSESDLTFLDCDEEDATVPDRAEDIKPRHHKSKSHAVENGPDEPKQDGDSEDDDDEIDDEIYAEWNLRKCSAATIDCMSNVYGDEILEIILPVLNEQLTHKDWRNREAGILCLGAISEGCHEGIQPHLPQLIPFLFESLKAPKALVRSIACWTLGRYVNWCLHPSDGADLSGYFEPMLNGLLQMIMDKNKRVQESACSAFATVEEEAGEIIVPYVEHILRVLMTAYSVYQRKNVLMLYDTIGTLAEAVGERLNEQRLIDLLMPPLINKWNQLSDDDPGLFPLLECISAIAIALGPGFQQFAAPVYDRCLRLVQKTLTEIVQSRANPSIEEPERDTLIIALDLVSGIVQAMKSNTETLIGSREPNLIQILMYAANDSIGDVRQSAFALVGDLAIHVFNQLKPVVPELLPVLIENLNPSIYPDNPSVCNNACWAIGEIALMYGPQMEGSVQVLLERLVPLMNMTNLPRTVRENVAITLGRLGAVSTHQVAAHLQQFAENWCKVLRHARDNPEKESAFRGFCLMVLGNPNGLANAFPLFCDAVGQWQDGSPQLFDLFRQVLHGFKSMMGDQWSQYYQTFPPILRQRLGHYHL